VLFPFALGGAYGPERAALAACGLVVAAGAIPLRAARAVGWALALLLAEDAVTIVGGAGGAVTTLAMALLLLVDAEVSFAAAEVRTRARYERAVVAFRVRTLLLVLGCSLVADAVLLLGISASSDGGEALTVAGAAATVLVLAVLVRLNRSPRATSSGDAITGRR
jgi:hypothetical protein